MFLIFTKVLKTLNHTFTWIELDTNSTYLFLFTLSSSIWPPTQTSSTFFNWVVAFSIPCHWPRTQNTPTISSNIQQRLSNSAAFHRILKKKKFDFSIMVVFFCWFGMWVCCGISTFAFAALVSSDLLVLFFAFWIWLGGLFWSSYEGCFCLLKIVFVFNVLKEIGKWLSFSYIIEDS